MFENFGRSSFSRHCRNFFIVANLLCYVMYSKWCEALLLCEIACFNFADLVANYYMIILCL